MEALKLAIADAVITGVWISCVSSIGAITDIAASAAGAEGFLPSILITTAIVFLIVFVFGLICDIAGGASFNPTGNAAFYVVGMGNDSLVSMAIRFPAQAIGAAAGVVAIVEYMPAQYKHTLSGPSLKVDLHTGAAAEGVLTFVITFVVLWIVIKGPKSHFVKCFMIAVSTIAMVLTGSSFTGPSMNPANAFGWAYINNLHNTFEQFYVYWACPFVGALLAAMLFKAVFPPPPPPKAKKA